MKGVLAFLVGLIAPVLAFAGPDASVVVDRGNSPGSKPAPLYVHFDASTATSTVSGDQPWRDLLFEWDYGDPSSGNFATTGLPRNRSTGPTGAHVYENPGTYTVRLTITDSTGSQKIVDSSVVVDNPDTVWGSTTSCVSSSGTFTGCPVGAFQLTSSDFTAAMTARANAGSRRILFRSGETFTAGSCWGTPNQKTEALVSRFGSGAQPIIQITAGNTDCAVRPQGSSVNSATSGGWRFVDLKMLSTSGNLAWGFKTSFLFDDLTIYKMDIGPTGFGFNVGPDQSGLNTAHRHYAVVDTQLRGSFPASADNPTNPGSCFFGGADKLFIAGVVCGQANVWQMRIAFTNKAVIIDNIVAEHAGAFEAIKFHCSRDVVSSGLACSFMVFADNIIAKEHVNLGTGSQENQAIMDRSIFERNVVPSGFSTIHPNDIFRFNVTSGVDIRNRQSPADAVEPRNIIIEQNVFDRRGGSIASAPVIVQGSVNKIDGLTIRNNLVYRPAGSVPIFVNGGAATGTVTQAGNVTVVSPSPFVVSNPNPLVAANYALPEGSARINAGVSVRYKGFDVLQHAFAQGSPDVGAVEFVGNAPPPPECTIDANCADGDQCTADACVSGTCTHPIATGLTCNDGNGSTINDVCSSLGVCAGTPVECTIDADCGSDGNQCHSSACVANACTHPNKANGTTCDDANASTTNDVCTAGSCAGTVPTCTPACVSDQCNASACVLGTCVGTPLVGATCNDGNAATENDRCWNGNPSTCSGVTPPPTTPPPTPTTPKPGPVTGVTITDE